MITVKSKALERSLAIDRIIGELHGKNEGPTVIFLAGIHGNEPSGVFALHKVFEDLKDKEHTLNGHFYGIAGNMPALQRKVRFINKDLNRLWKSNIMQKINAGEVVSAIEDMKELITINESIKSIIARHQSPLYFVDLHTTSSESIPFMTVNDSLLNRAFTEQYPVPNILGIEEYLDGPVLGYLNELGFVSFGFEGGQHDSLAAIDNHIAFIYLTLTFADVLTKESINYHHFHDMLAKTSIHAQGIYEVYYCHRLSENEKFKMNPGYVNFQRIKKNEVLASSNGQPVKAKTNGRIFMPLYQPQGDDGFYTIRKVSLFFLKLSEILRKIKFDRILPLLPGIRRSPTNDATLLVNLHIARFMAKPFFHLLGYRYRIKDDYHLILKNREYATRTEDYAKTDWMG